MNLDIHTPDEVNAEVELLWADKTEVEYLMSLGVLRPGPSLEDDLRIEAYNRLTSKKVGK